MSRSRSAFAARHKIVWIVLDEKNTCWMWNGKRERREKEMSRCRSCGAEINWIRMASGKSMPVDPYLRSMIKGEGRDTLVTEDGAVIHGRLAAYEDGANASGYISHFSTCPNADSHRKRG